MQAIFSFSQRKSRSSKSDGDVLDDFRDGPYIAQVGLTVAFLSVARSEDFLMITLCLRELRYTMYSLESIMSHYYHTRFWVKIYIPSKKF